MKTIQIILGMVMMVGIIIATLVLTTYYAASIIAKQQIIERQNLNKSLLDLQATSTNCVGGVEMVEAGDRVSFVCLGWEATSDIIKRQCENQAK